MEKIRENYRFLVESIDTMLVLDYLIEKGFDMQKAASIRCLVVDGQTHEANRTLLDSLRQMKGGNGYDHFIDVLRKQNNDFILDKLDSTSGSTTASPCAVQPSSRGSRDRQHRDLHDSSVAANRLDEADGALNTKKSQGPPEGNTGAASTTSPNTQVQGIRIQCENSHYEECENTHSAHEYQTIIGDNGEVCVNLAKPTYINCATSGGSSCPRHLWSLTEDSAYHEYVNDRTIHKVTAELSKYAHGTYIMWYSQKKEVMLVSVALRRSKKRYVHFKMTKDGEHFRFDHRFKNTDPVKVLKFAKEYGLIISHHKVLKYGLRQ